MRKPGRIVLSCEHASNRVPARYAFLFASCPEVLQTHRGVDIGIAPMARQMQKLLNSPLCEYRWSRLLIDPNRCRRANLFSEFSVALPAEQKADLLETYYRPYQTKLTDEISRCMQRGHPVLHLSLHSFTSVWKGSLRNADMGILYDPARKKEQQLAIQLQECLRTLPLKIRRNYPYQGKADGLTTEFRKRWPQKHYLGFELEFNQAMLTAMSQPEKTRLLKTCADALQALWRKSDT